MSLSFAEISGSPLYIACNMPKNIAEKRSSIIDAATSSHGGVLGSRITQSNAAEQMNAPIGA